ncbi:MAG: ACT domain-containing protein [Candidatus Dormibacterales bacterium]
MTWLSPQLSVCRMGGADPLPDWAAQEGALVCTVRTAEELSIVCESNLVPNGVKCEGPFRALQLAGPIPLAAVGVLSSLLSPIAKAGISVFVVSTFDTDYVLVPDSDQLKATETLAALGHLVE